jgi:hypothetical protein
MSKDVYEAAESKGTFTNSSHSQGEARVRLSLTSGVVPHFCRGEFDMWRWVDCDRQTDTTIVSREAFSNICDCAKDAVRDRKYRCARGAL